MKSNWNKIYRIEKENYISSASPLLKIIPLFKQKNVKRILDIGCGIGKHSIYLAKNDFNVVGIDVAEEAINIAKKLSKKENVKVDFRLGSMYALPFSNEEFDAIISLRTINHGRKEQVKMAINEIYRVLKSRGLAFISTIKILGKKKILGQTRLNKLPVKIIEPYTYVPLEGKEKGIVHFSFNKKLLFRLFNGFKLKNFWVEKGKESWEKYYCLLAEKP